MNLNCIHYNQGCSGCALSEALSAPPIFTEANHFFKNELNFELTTVTGSLKGWRTRAKLAVRGTSESPIVGLFREGTHDALDIPCCQVQHPFLNVAADCIRLWIKAEKISPYNESTLTGQLRYIQLTLDEESQTVQIALILNAPLSEASLAKLWTLGSFHSLWINYNTSRTNTIWGEKWEKIQGIEWLTETFLGHKYLFHPAAFIQANPEMFNALLADIKKEILPFKNVVEFYAGVGVIGLSILDNVRNLVLSELNKTGKMCFDKNICAFEPALQKRASYQELDAAKGIHLLKEAEVVIVDPPRKGLEKALLEKLLQKQKIKQIVYISCGFPAFMRESKELIKAGYTLSFAKGYLFFPGTNHIETLAIFSRFAEGPQNE